MIRNDSICRITFTARDIRDLDAMRNIHDSFIDFIDRHSDSNIFNYGLLSYVDKEIARGEDLSTALEEYISNIFEEDGSFVERVETPYLTYVHSGLVAVVERLHKEHSEIGLRVDVENYPDMRVTDILYTICVSAAGATKESITSFVQFVKRLCNTDSDPKIFIEGGICSISVSSENAVALSDEIIEKIVHEAFTDELMFISCDVSRVSRVEVKNPKTLTPTNCEEKPSSVHKPPVGIKPLMF